MSATFKTCIGPTLLMRPVVTSDEDFIFELFQDWDLDGRTKFTQSAAAGAVEKYIEDMAGQPATRPCQPNTIYAETVVIEKIVPAGENVRIGLDRYIVRGSQRSKNRTGVHELATELTALIPSYRHLGITGGEFSNIACRFAFESCGVHAMIYPSLNNSKEIRGLIASRGWTEDGPLRFEQKRSEKKKQGRRAAVFTRADWVARLAKNPMELNAKYQFRDGK